MFKKTRSVLIFVVLTAMICLFSGCKDLQEAQPGDYAQEPLEIMVFSHSSWPFDKDWWIWDTIEKETGVDISVMGYSNYRERFNIVVNSGNMPDLLNTYTDIAQIQGEAGSLLNLLPLMGEMPNFAIWKEKYPEVYKNNISADGSIYSFPTEGIEETEQKTWLYRKDIFEKHGIELPATYDELYAVLKQLKEIYPDSYPFAMRSFHDQLILMAKQWNTSASYYYDQTQGQWVYGPIEQNFRAFLSFMNKLYEDELMPPDFMTLGTSQWQDAITSGKAFVTIDYIIRIDFYNVPARSSNPSFTIAFMPPPAGNVDDATRLFPYTRIINLSLSAAASTKKQSSIIKLMDYFYSKEGREVLSWGIEGETYTVEDGRKKFINVSELADIRKNYGISTHGTYTWFDYDSHRSTFSDQMIIDIEKSNNYEEPLTPSPVFSAKEYAVLDTTGVKIDNYAEEQIAKFIMGIRSLDEFDRFVSEIYSLGLESVLEAYRIGAARKSG